MRGEMIEVIVTDEFRRWYEDLGEADAAAVYLHVGLLEARGVALGHPYSSAIKGTKYAIRELRIRSGRKQLRVFYAFDPTRNAVLLLGGDKTGRNKFYEEFVPRAEKLWKEYLDDLGRKK
jgi:hypothetical protein